MNLLARDGEHALALVEANDLAKQVSRQKAGTARDVECPRGGQGGNHPSENLELLFPARPVAVGVEALAEPPVVVLGCPPVVVGLHPS